MSEDEYYASEPGGDPRDLPSTFLSDEDIATDTNVIIVPNMKINLNLILDNYVEVLCKEKTKDELKFELMKLWGHASSHGALAERLDKLTMEVDMLQMDIDAMNDGYTFEIELVDGDGEDDDYV